MKLRSPLAAGASVALAAIGNALWVERQSRDAERRYHAPHHHIYIHGTHLHYRLVGEGPPVLLVHGNLVHGADWEASGLLERLAERHQVLVIDRPGFGFSDRPRRVTWTPAQQARLLHDAAEALDVYRPVVVGHSLGTQVALAMALQQPAGVAGLVLVSGYYWPNLRLDRWLAVPAALPLLGDVLRYTASAWTARATVGATLRAIFDPEPVPEAFTQLLPRELLLRPLQQRATAEDGSHMVGQARALQPHYGTLRMPVTVVAGTQDRIVSPEQAVRLHQAVPRARLRLLDGVGHMAHYQAHEQILDGVAEALAAYRASPLVRGTDATVPGMAAGASIDDDPVAAFR
jgi:pimeloyl-ACP methyl ester carboxylesterase